MFITFYGLVNSLRLESTVFSKWGREHLWGYQLFCCRWNTDKTNTHEAILIPSTKKHPNYKAAIKLTQHSLLQHLQATTQTRGLGNLQESPLTLGTNLQPPFTPTVTLKAIRKTKNSTGPGGISYPRLIQLGPQPPAPSDIFKTTSENSPKSYPSWSPTNLPQIQPFTNP